MSRVFGNSSGSRTSIENQGTGVALSRVKDFHIGLIVPSSNLTMETELPEMLQARRAVFQDERFIFHSSRMRMKKVTAEELAAMEEA